MLLALLGPAALVLGQGRRRDDRPTGPSKMLTFRECDDRYPGMFMKASGKPKDSAYKVAAKIGKKHGRTFYIAEDKLDAYMQECGR